MWERLVSAGEEEVAKSKERWSDRQQAARFEDQQDFAKFVKEKKGLKNDHKF